MGQEDDALESKKEFWRETPESRMLKLLEKLSERVQANEDESRRKADETQRNMDFIVQQQARFVEDIQKLSEAQARTQGIVERLAVVSLNRFEKVEGELESKMSALIDSHIRLVDTQAQTDERLSTFITTVERLISEGRNGGSDAPEV
ncbi:MAG TPA: hypothetical protein VF064_14770 [Pyrinomonadaceae bacterium]